MSLSAFEARFQKLLCGGGTRLLRGRQALAILVAYLLFAATYLPINEFSVGRRAHILYLPGEERLPFLPLFEYLYVLTYFLPLLFLRTIHDYAVFRRLYGAFFIVLLVAYTTYLLFPVYLERPPLKVDSLHTWLLSLEYMDKSYNHFPSLHVAWTWLTVYASQVSPKAKTGLAVLAVGISLSTLFVKQHYIADVLYGYALAWLAWRLAGSRRP